MLEGVSFEANEIRIAFVYCMTADILKVAPLPTGTAFEHSNSFILHYIIGVLILTTKKACFKLGKM